MHLLRRAAVVSGRGLVLGRLFDELAAVHGDRRLVEHPGEPPSSLSYHQAADRVARWSSAVAAQTSPGDRVIAATADDYDLLLLCVAIARAGAIPVPVNPRMRDDEIDHVIGDSGAALVVRDTTSLGVAERLDMPAPAAPEDVAAIFYTSGTTGKPKGARLTHRALVGQVGAAALWPSRLRRDEAVIALPVAHIMGFAVLLALAAAGIPVYQLPRFDADAVLDAIEERRATIFVGVPAMYRMLLDAGAEKRDLSSVRLWASGADVMPPELARRFKDMGAIATVPFLNVSIGQAAFAEGYGMVESGGGVAGRLSPPGFELPFGDSLGIPLPGYRFKVVDDDGRDVAPGQVGELLVRGPGILEGYHGDEEATAQALTADGWLRTGDLARKGMFGLVAFAGRKKDVVKHGGYSVFAVEVERSLEEHPDVVEAAVVGLADERKGEIPVAAVRLRPGATVTGDQLVDWARDHMATYKWPRQVVVVDDLPRTGTTKVQKRQLLALFGGERSRSRRST